MGRSMNRSLSMYWDGGWASSSSQCLVVVSRQVCDEVKGSSQK
ncbi:hypothetical protein MY11210_007711 [Beauveria gryllotalpidicola]